MSADNNTTTTTTTTTVSLGGYAAQQKEEDHALRNQNKLQKEEEKARVKDDKKAAAEAAKAEKKAANEAAKAEKKAANEAAKVEKKAANEAAKVEKKAANEAAKVEKKAANKAEKKAANEAAKVEKKAANKAEKKTANEAAKVEKKAANKAAAEAGGKTNSDPDTQPDNDISDITEDPCGQTSYSEIQQLDSNIDITMSDNSKKNEHDDLSNKNLKFMVFAFYIMRNAVNANKEFDVNQFVNCNRINDLQKFAEMMELFFKNFNSIHQQFSLFKNNHFNHFHLLSDIAFYKNNAIDIDVKLHIINGQKVLIDKNNIVYHFRNHIPIGVWRNNQITQ